jgi:hypothetical protein
MAHSATNSERRALLTAAMLAAGCTEPKDWVRSELAEDIPQFARFLMLRDVHRLADAVDDTLTEALYDQPGLQRTLDVLRAAVPRSSLDALLLAYGKALGNGFVMALDQGPAAPEEGMPGWQLIETDADGAPTGRRVEGLHEDYLDFDTSYARLSLRGDLPSSPTLGDGDA